MRNKRLFVDSELNVIGKKVGLTAIDVGARGGVNLDLSPVASSVDYFGFEPDPKECAALNEQQVDVPWKSSCYLPYALSDAEKNLTLNLYSKAGCTSCYEALPERGALFSRGDYYHEVGQVQIPSVRLDQLVDQQQLQAPDFIKIDVQGMEIEVFEGAGTILNLNTVAIRSEVCFYELYKGQPLFGDIDAYLRERNFVAMHFSEMHEWRRLTKSKKPYTKGCEITYSKGQLMHADVLYLQQPEGMRVDTEADVHRLVRLGLVAVCYDQFDHASAAFSRPEVREFCRQINVDALGGLMRTAATRSRWNLRLALCLRNLANKLER
mgnify:CR=1 FL=1